MNDILKTLASRVEDLLGPGKPFRSASALAKRAHTMGLIDNPQNFARSINRVRNGEADVQITTVAVIARAANLRVSDLLEDAPAGASASSSETLEAKLSGERERAERLSRTVLLLLEELDNTREGALWATVDRARDELSNRRFDELLELAGGFETLQPEEIIALWRDVSRRDDQPLSTLGRFLSMAITSQKAIDTQSPQPDAIKNLIKETRDAASSRPSSEGSESIQANATSRRGTTVKRR